MPSRFDWMQFVGFVILIIMLVLMLWGYGPT